MEFSMLGVTVLLPLLWAIMIVFDIQRAMYGVAAASREATRAFTLSSSPAEGQADAERAATLAMESQNLSGYTVPQVTCEGADGNTSQATCLTPGSTAHIEMSYAVEMPFWPTIFGMEPPAIPVSAEHTTPYGQYRTAG